MSKPGHGFRLYQRPGSPAWYADWWVQDPSDPDGRRRLRCSTGTDDEEEARRIVYRKLAINGHSAPAIQDAPLPLADLSARYLAYLDRETQSGHRAKPVLDRFLAYCPPGIAARDITRDVIDGWVTFRLRTGQGNSRANAPRPLTKGAMKRELGIVSAMFGQGVELYGLSAIPIAKLTKKRIKPPKQNPKSYRKEEIRLLLAVSPEPWRSIWLVYLNSGLRRGAARQLKKIHDRGHALFVPYSISKDKEDLVIPINAELREAISTLATYTNGSDSLLPRYRPSSISHAFTRLAITAGIGGNLHRLRHSFGRHLTEQGVPIQDVAALMGHSNVNTTMIYTMADPPRLRNAVDGLRFQNDGVHDP